MKSGSTSGTGSSGSSPRTEAKTRHEVVAMSAASKRVHRIIRVIVSTLCRIYFRMEVRGQDRLPVAGPYILAPVHRSNLDAFIAASSVPSSVVLRTMAKDSLWKSPRFGRFLEKMGSFPVDREKTDRSVLRSGEQALAQGEPLLMFPEGRRMSGPTVMDVLEGPAWLACRARVPIVPVGIAGSERAMPIGVKMIRPAKVIVEIGEPLLPDVPLVGRVRHKAIVELSAELKDRVQEVYDIAKKG